MKISIIVPVYNRPALIKESTASVLDQSYKDWELLIVDDHSTDETREIIKSYADQDERIKVYQVENSKKGACAARNLGISNSTGEYLIFLDSDDLLAKDCLQNRVNYIRKHPALDFLVFQTQEFSRKAGDSDILINTLEHTETELDRFLKRDNPWLTTGPIWKREAIIEIGKWDEKLLSWQDWELNIRALSSSLNYYTFNIIDSYWRRPSANTTISKNSNSKTEHLEVHEYTLIKIHNILASEDLLNKSRRQSIASLLFWLSMAWRKKGQVAKAREIWQLSKQYDLITEDSFRRGEKLLLSASWIKIGLDLNSILIDKVCERIFYYLTPQQIRIPMSSTFHKFS